jgi:hypothetical protein
VPSLRPPNTLYHNSYGDRRQRRSPLASYLDTNLLNISLREQVASDFAGCPRSGVFRSRVAWKLHPRLIEVGCAALMYVEIEPRHGGFSMKRRRQKILHDRPVDWTGSFNG